MDESLLGAICHDPNRETRFRVSRRALLRTTCERYSLATSRRKFIKYGIAAAGAAALGYAGILAFSKPTPLGSITTTTTGQSNVGAGLVSYIDTHAHLQGRYGGGTDYDGASEIALATMKNLAIQKSLIMAPPQPADLPGGTWDYSDFAYIARNDPARFAFLGGGGTLNPLIQESIKSGTTTPDSIFEEKASEILRADAVGFGELAAEHLSLREGHPYVSAPPDHPLFLLLADIASGHEVPIDLHMEAVARDIALPSRLRSPPNPTILRENITAFERMLSHNREARIVWAHAGWDNTGHRTIALSRRLLETHSNLYMSIKIGEDSLQENRPLKPNGEIQPEWVDLIRSFPDRFVIGSDQFYVSPRSNMSFPSSSQGPRDILNQLPSDVAPKVAYENPVSIYRLNQKMSA